MADTEQIDMEKVREQVARLLCKQLGDEWDKLQRKPGGMLVSQEELLLEADQFQPLIEQAKQDVARDIFKELDKQIRPLGMVRSPQREMQSLITEDWYKEFKSRYLGNKGGKK